MSIIAEAMPELAEMARRGGPLWIREAAKVAGVKPRTVRSWIFSGKRGRFLVAYRCGGTLATTAGELLRFLEET